VTWRVGSASIRRITEVETWRFPPTDLFASWTDADTLLAAGRYPSTIDPGSGELVLSIHTYLIDIGDRRILVDTGNGDHKQRPALLPHHMLTAGYPERLRAAGVDPGSIQTITTTHLHPDHCGGNTVLVEGEWTTAFPNAEYLLSQGDLRLLQVLDAEALEGTVAADIARTYRDSVLPLGTAVRAVTGPEVVAEHRGTVVRLVPAPGHSPGHLVVRVDTPNGGGAVLVGDLIHHPLQLDRLMLANNGDDDSDLALLSRAAVLGEAALNRRLVLTAHFPVGSPEAVRTTEDRLSWVAPESPTRSQRNPPRRHS
jgi:glyoxylase-like metal-dependent hydrolase (beta-lactamase superfamily II)